MIEQSIQLHIGPMWSGKTTILANSAKEVLKKGGGVVVYDDINTRNSDRDLTNVLSHVSEIYWNTSLKIVPDAKLVIFDEVHLYQALRHEDLFWERFHTWKDRGVDIGMAGIYFDCYTGYAPFRILTSLFALCTQIIPHKSLRPCAVCGKNDNVIFTRNTRGVGDAQGKVGDHYENVCLACKEDCEVTRVVRFS
jgi:thymidine kinase